MVAHGGRARGERVPGGPRDTHTLALHPLAPGRLYAAAGDGYFESRDGGNTWQRPRQGLQHHYLWGVAVNAAEPDIVLVSAASGAHAAHNIPTAESHIYRKTKAQEWRSVGGGLPDPKGTTISMLAAARSEPGVFYAANNHGLYRSTDAGQTWQSLDVHWPQPYRSQRVQALTVVEIDS
jgi:photosystem II stability/assembly factor-like uncharacterized protein